MCIYTLFFFFLLIEGKQVFVGYTSAFEADTHTHTHNRKKQKKKATTKTRWEKKKRNNV